MDKATVLPYKVLYHNCLYRDSNYLYHNSSEYIRVFEVMGDIHYVEYEKGSGFNNILMTENFIHTLLRPKMKLVKAYDRDLTNESWEFVFELKTLFNSIESERFRKINVEFMDEARTGIISEHFINITREGIAGERGWYIKTPKFKYPKLQVGDWINLYDPRTIKTIGINALEYFENPNAPIHLDAAEAAGFKSLLVYSIDPDANEIAAVNYGKSGSIYIDVYDLAIGQGIGSQLFVESIVDKDKNVQVHDLKEEIPEGFRPCNELGLKAEEEESALDSTDADSDTDVEVYSDAESELHPVGDLIKKAIADAAENSPINELAKTFKPAPRVEGVMVKVVNESLFIDEQEYVVLNTHKGFVNNRLNSFAISDFTFTDAVSLDTIGFIFGDDRRHTFSLVSGKNPQSAYEEVILHSNGPKDRPCNVTFYAVKKSDSKESQYHLSTIIPDFVINLHNNDNRMHIVKPRNGGLAISTEGGHEYLYRIKGFHEDWITLINLEEFYFVDTYTKARIKFTLFAQSQDQASYITVISAFGMRLPKFHDITIESEEGTVEATLDTNYSRVAQEPVPELKVDSSTNSDTVSDIEPHEVSFSELEHTTQLLLADSLAIVLKLSVALRSKTPYDAEIYKDVGTYISRLCTAIQS